MRRPSIFWCGSHKHTGALLSVASPWVHSPLLGSDGVSVCSDTKLTLLLFSESLLVDNELARGGPQLTS